MFCDSRKFLLPGKSAASKRQPIVTKSFTLPSSTGRRKKMEETKPEKGSALFNLVMFVISSILKQMSCRPNYPCFFFSFFFFFFWLALLMGKLLKISTAQLHACKTGFVQGTHLWKSNAMHLFVQTYSVLNRFSDLRTRTSFTYGRVL